MGMRRSAAWRRVGVGAVRTGARRRRREQRVGDFEQPRGDVGWAKREHVFVKVPGSADGPWGVLSAPRMEARKPRRHGEFGRRMLQEILQGIGSGSCRMSAAVGVGLPFLRRRASAPRRRPESALRSSVGSSTSCRGRCRGRTGMRACSRSTHRRRGSCSSVRRAALPSTTRASCWYGIAASTASETRSAAPITCSRGRGLAGAGAEACRALSPRPLGGALLRDGH